MADEGGRQSGVRGLAPSAIGLLRVACGAGGMREGREASGVVDLVCYGETSELGGRPQALREPIPPRDGSHAHVHCEPNAPTTELLLSVPHGKDTGVGEHCVSKLLHTYMSII